MKKIFLAILILGSACSETGNSDDKLTNSNWETDKVVDLKNGSVMHTEMDEEKIWDFEIDNSYHYETKKGDQKQSLDGKWQLDGSNLLVIDGFDSTKILIEEITDDEMVWLIKGEDSLRFYLTSKVRKVVLPDLTTTFDSQKNTNTNK